MINLGLSLVGQLLGSVTPAGLLGPGSTAFIWFDPSDVANTNWRRNLLTWTEQFDNAAWLAGNASVTANASVAPDGTTTSDRLVENTANNLHNIQCNFSGDATVVSGTTYVCSVYVKPDGRTSIVFRTGGTGLGDAGAVIDIATGAISSQFGSPVSVTATSVGNGWYRVSVAKAAASNGTGRIYIALNSSSPATPNGQTYTGDGTSGIFIWGAQLEVGSTATEYQRITDVNTEVIQRFPTATMFQDAAGTTPVTAPAQPVGLVLDKSQGLVLGPELVANGDFSNGTTGWTSFNANLSVVSGSLRFTSITDGQTGAYTQITTVAGRTYRVSLNFVTDAANGNTFLTAGTTSTGSELASVNAGSVLGDYSFVFTATGTTTFIRFVTSSTATAGQFNEIDNISVRELPGFHATQTTSANRPTYGVVPSRGRVNLLVRSEEFNDAGWSKVQATVSANAVVASDGTTTADSILDTAVSNIHYCAQDITSLAPSGKTYTVSAYAKANTLNFMTLGISDISSGTLYAVAVFNLSTGTVSTSGAAGTGYSVVSSSVSAVGDGWYRCVVTVVAGTSVTFLRCVLAPNKTGIITDSAGGFESYLGNGSGFYAWGAQLELGSTATTYQRVASQFEVTDPAGFPTYPCHYLQFDGVDDFLVTPTITPNADKVQVFAGVRKLSDAAESMLIELSTSSFANFGTFALWGNQPTTTTGIRVRAGGTLFATADGVFGSSPRSGVLSFTDDISADSAALRINGAQAVTSSADQGAGNFLAYPLYIGRRGGTSLPFNGQLFGLIVRFSTANLDAGLISQTERWMAGKTAGVTF